jgi:hypothetical protein
MMNRILLHSTFSSNGKEILNYVNHDKGRSEKCNGFTIEKKYMWQLHKGKHVIYDQLVSVPIHFISEA